MRYVPILHLKRIFRLSKHCGINFGELHKITSLKLFPQKKLQTKHTRQIAGK